MVMIINSYDSANLLIIKQEKHFVLNYLIVTKKRKIICVTISSSYVNIGI
jgi:hypothetical protein